MEHVVCFVDYTRKYAIENELFFKRTLSIGAAAMYRYFNELVQYDSALFRQALGFVLAVNLNNF